jgi:hypothetical protein
MSEPIVHVFDPGCCTCQEQGADGTEAHSDGIVGRAEVIMGPVKVTADFCENHRANYEHWTQIPLPEQAKVEVER